MLLRHVGVEISSNAVIGRFANRRGWFRIIVGHVRRIPSHARHHKVQFSSTLFSLSRAFSVIRLCVGTNISRVSDAYLTEKTLLFRLQFHCFGTLGRILSFDGARITSFDLSLNVHRQC